MEHSKQLGNTLGFDNSRLRGSRPHGSLLSHVLLRAINGMSCEIGGQGTRHVSTGRSEHQQLSLNCWCSDRPVFHPYIPYGTRCRWSHNTQAATVSRMRIPLHDMRKHGLTGHRTAYRVPSTP